MRIIDADKLLKQIERHCIDDEILCKDDVIEIIEEVPTIEERPTGHWIEHFNKAQNDYDIECSECSVWQDWRLVRRSFCPNCGADMKGAKK